VPLFVLDASGFPAYLRRKPLNISQTVSIGAGATGSVAFAVPPGRTWLVQQVLITAGTGINVTACLFDGAESGIRQSISDCRAYFGDLLVAEETVKVDATNSGTTAADLRVQLVGLEV